LRLTEEDLPGRFSQNENVGVLLGEPAGGLTDSDLDVFEAIELAPHFMPDTKSIFGRPGKQRSHRLYYCDIETIKFQTSKEMIMELRSTGCQTVFPGSTHPSGEKIEWYEDGEPTWISSEELKTASGKLAAAALLARNWPAEGSRQNAALALAGGLSRAGWDENEAAHFIEAVAIAAGDEETKSRVRTVAGTFKKRDVPITGWPTLAGLVGKDTVDHVIKWLNIKRTQEEQPWPEPEPIKNTLRHVESITQDIIPGPLRPWLKDISFRMQCPLDFVAVGAITEAGAIIGSGCGIRPKQKDDWLVVPNLWGGVVASPSMLKTPSLAEALKPLARLEAEARGVYETEVAFYEADVEEHKAKRDALKAEMSTAAKGKAKANEKVPDMDDVKARFAALEKPEEPTRRRYKTNDATVEKVGELLNQNPRGILIFRDELVGLLMSWEREDRQTDRAFYLETWNGYGSFTTDRISRGTIDINNLCISIMGGIQPGKLTGYLHQASSDLQNDGLIQRMQLLVYPDEPAKWELIDECPDTEARNKAYDVFESLAKMNFAECGAELPEGELIPFFHFSSEAQEIFNQWLTGLQEKLQTEESPLMVEHLAKYRSLMPSLALIFHLINVADGQTGGPVSSQAAHQATAWCEYLESHARRIYGLVADISTRAASELALKIKKGALHDGFTLRDVYRNCWHLLGKKELVQDACSELIEAGWLRESFSEMGKTKPVYTINPKIFL